MGSTGSYGVAEGGRAGSSADGPTDPRGPGLSGSSRVATTQNPPKLRFADLTSATVPGADPPPCSHAFSSNHVARRAVCDFCFVSLTTPQAKIEDSLSFNCDYQNSDITRNIAISIFLFLRKNSLCYKYLQSAA